MNYGYRISNGNVCDNNYLRYAGWDQNNLCFKSFFSGHTIDLIQRKIGELTKGLDEKNRTIIVPKETICNIMNGVYDGFVPPVGDIYTRYIIPKTNQQDMIQSLIDQTIEIIFSNIRNTYKMEQFNSSLTKWVEVMGDFNVAGLRQHSPIKIRERRPSTMQFNMNY